MFLIPADLEKFDQHGPLLTHVISQHITVICVAQNETGPISRPVISFRAPRVV